MSKALDELAAVMEKHGLEFHASSESHVSMWLSEKDNQQRLPTDRSLWTSIVNHKHIHTLSQQEKES